MKVLMLAVQLLFSTHSTSFEYGTDSIIESVGFALNEASCIVKPYEDNPSCVAYCYTSLEWLTFEDILPVCKDVVDMRGDMHGELLDEVNNETT